MKNVKYFLLSILFLHVSSLISHCQYIDNNRYFFESNSIDNNISELQKERIRDYEKNKETFERPTTELEVGDYNNEAYPSPELHNLTTSTAVEGDWTEIGPLSDGQNGNTIGRIDYIAFPDPNDPMNIFACSPTGGLFHTTNGGTSWTNAGTDKLPLCGVSNIAFDDQNSSNIWYIATGMAQNYSTLAQNSYGVFRTTDAGNTWESIGLTIDQLASSSTGCKYDKMHQINKIIQIPNKPGHILVAASDGFFESTNALDGTTYGNASGSVSFSRVIVDNTFDIELIPGTTKCFITTRGYYCTVRDIGVRLKLYVYDYESHIISTYTNSNFVIKDCATWQSIEVSKSDPGKAYILETDKHDTIINDKKVQVAQHHFYRVNFAFIPTESIDIQYIGQLWTGYNDLCIGSLCLSSTDKDKLLVGTCGATYQYLRMLTISNASTATPPLIPKTPSGTTNIHADVQYITNSPDGSELWVGTDGGVAKSTNNGASWTSMNNGLGVATIYNMDVSQSEPLTVIHGNQDCGTRVMRQNADKTWTSIYQRNGDDYSCLIDPKNSDHFYSNYGKMSTYEHNWPSNGYYIFSSSNYKLNSSDANIVYFTKTDGLYKSTPSNRRGEKWSLFPDVTNQTPGNFGVSTNPDHSNFIYVLWTDGTANKIFKTSSGGGTDPSNWSAINYPEGLSMSGTIIVDYYDPHHIWLVGWHEIYSINTITNEWFHIEYGPWGINSVIQDRENGTVYFGCWDGVYYIHNGSTSCIKYDGAIPNVKVNEVKINYQTMSIFAGTLGRGVWAAPLVCNPSAANISLSSITTDVSQHASNNITCNGAISSSKRVFLRAGSRIDFNPGFTTSDKTIMNAYVLPCSASGLKSTSAISGAYSSDVGLAEEAAFKPIPSAASISPNPTNGIINIMLKGELKSTQIDVFDNYGKKLLSQTTLDETASFDLSGYTKGIYMVTVRNNDFVKTFKVMVR